jgi:hypothetical protein
MEGELGALTCPRQGWAEDPFDGLTGTSITPTHSAFVLPQVRAQNPVTAHMLHGEGSVGGGGVMSPPTPYSPSLLHLPRSPLHLALAADTNVHSIWAAGRPIHHSCGPLGVEVEAFC